MEMPLQKEFQPFVPGLATSPRRALPDVLPHYLWMRVKRRRHSQQWSSLTFRWESKWIMHWLPCARVLLPCVAQFTVGPNNRKPPTKNLGNWLVILMPAAVWQIFDHAATHDAYHRKRKWILVEKHNRAFWPRKDGGRPSRQQEHWRDRCVSVTPVKLT